MAITRANKLGTASAGSGTSLSITVSATTTAANRIIVTAIWGAGNLTAKVTDSQGNIYSSDGGPGTGSDFAQVFSTRADNPLTSGVDTITITWQGTVNNVGMAAYEYSGIAFFQPTDQASAGRFSGPTITSPSLTTTNANDLIFAVFDIGGIHTLSSPTGTELDRITVNSNRVLETQEKIVSATGTYSLGLTDAFTDGGNAVIVAYSDTAIPTPPVNTKAPAITGTGVIGMQLTCSQGYWSNVPTGYVWQWKRAGVAITGATRAHYLVTSSDTGHALSCDVTASNKYGSATHSSSNTVTP